MNYADILAKLPSQEQAYQQMGISHALDTRERQQVPQSAYALPNVDRYSPVATSLQLQNSKSMKADAETLMRLQSQRAALQAGYDAKVAQLNHKFANNPAKLDRKLGKQEAMLGNKMGRIDTQLAPIQAMPYYQQLQDLIQQYPVRAGAIEDKSKQNSSAHLPLGGALYGSGDSQQGSSAGYGSDYGGMSGYGDVSGLYAKGGPINGPGTGTSDSIPATIDGAEPAALSDGEFVFTHAAVLGFGGGDEQSGHEALMRLMKMAEQIGAQYK